MYLSIYTYIYIQYRKIIQPQTTWIFTFFFKPLYCPLYLDIYLEHTSVTLNFPTGFIFFVSCNNNASHIHIWCQGHMLLNKKHYMWVITYGTICGYELHLLCYQTCGYDINTILYNLHQCINHVLLIKQTGRFGTPIDQPMEKLDTSHCMPIELPFLHSHDLQDVPVVNKYEYINIYISYIPSGNQMWQRK